MGVKICYGYYVILSSKRLPKCDVIMFINHLCILNKYTSASKSENNKKEKKRVKKVEKSMKKFV